MGTFKATFREGQKFGTSFGEVQKVSTSDYEELFNKPKIEGTTLVGDKSFEQLGLGELSEQEIDEIIFGGN